MKLAAPPSFPNMALGLHFRLRELADHDGPAFHEYYNDPDVGRYILTRKPKTPEDAQRDLNYCRGLFANGRGIFWAVSTLGDTRMIGMVGLYINAHHRRAEICYDLHKDYWRQGLISQALTKVCKYAFEERGLLRLEAIIAPANEPSAKLISKIGFTREGTLKNYKFYQERAWDIDLYAQTREEYFQKIQEIQDTQDK